MAAAVAIAVWAPPLRAFPVGGRAYGALLDNVSVVLIALPTFGPAPLAEQPAGGGTDSDSAANLAIDGGPLGLTAVLHSGLVTVQTTGDPAGNTVTSEAQITGLQLLTNLLTADAITSTCTLTPSGFTGNVSFTNVGSTLGALSPSLFVNTPPNTTVDVAGLGTLVINEQKYHDAGGMRTFEVNALRIALNVPLVATGTVTLNHAECSGTLPTVASIVAPSGPTGTTVTINGANFLAPATVTIGGLPATGVTVNGPTSITATVPARLPQGAWDVTVTTPIGDGTLAGGFTSTNTNPPLPVGGSAFGSELTLLILPFGPSPTVTVPVSTTPADQSDTLASINLPGVPPLPSPFLDTGVLTAHTVTNPISGTVDSTATSSGLNIGGGLLAASAVSSECHFGPGGFTGSSNLAGLSSTVLGDLSHLLDPPANFGLNIAGLGAIVLNEQTDTTAGGVRTFTVNALHVDVAPLGISLGSLFVAQSTCAVGAPTAASLAPASGPVAGGTPVVITGTNFAEPASVTFDGLPAASVTVDSATQITAVTPPHATLGNVPVVVTLPAGQVTVPGGFTYAPSANAVVSASGPSSVSPGGTLTYTIHVVNTGDAPIAGGTLDVPALPNIGPPTLASGGCATFPCTFSLAPGAALDTTATYPVPPTYTAPSPIVGTITATVAGDANPADNTFTVSTPVVAASDIEVTMTVDHPAPAAGTPVTFTITVHNNGPAPASFVDIVDKLPAGLTFTGATPSQGTYTPETGLWEAGGLPAGGSATLQLTGTVDTAGPITNTATRTGGSELDPDPSDNSAAFTLNGQPSADVRVAMSSNVANGPVGTTVIFTIVASNAGPSDASGLVVTDLLPAGLTLVSSNATGGTYDSGSGAWTVGTLASGASQTLTLTSTIALAGPLTNTAVKTAQTEADPSAASDRASVTINGQAADLQLVMTSDPAPAPPGSTVSVDLTLTNNGPDEATNVVVQPALPGGLTYVSSSPEQGSYDPGTNTWTIGTVPPLGPDGEAHLHLTGIVPAGGVTGVVPTATADQPDPNPLNNTPAALPASSGPVDLAASIALTGSLATAGPVTFQIGIANVGTGTATGTIGVRLALPSYVTITTPPAGWTCTLIGQVYACDRTDLAIAAGASEPVAIGGTVTAPGSSSDPVTVTVIYAPDVNLANNVATLPSSPPPGQTANLRVTQSGIENPAGHATFTITVTNDGPAPATGVTVADDLPAGLTLTSTSPSSIPCAGTSTIVCTIGTLAAGASAQVQISASAATAGSFTNTAAATSAVTDPDPSDSVSSFTITLQGTNGLDSDGDGMPDDWEIQYGLDPTRNDAAEDPDGDGKTNLQEYLTGTHPRGFYAQMYAEGAQGTFFDTELSLINADPAQTAKILVRFLLENGQVAPKYVQVLPLHRLSIDSTEVLGGASLTFSATIESDRPIGSARTMGWDHSAYGLSLESGPPLPATTWYFAEGSTAGDFSLYYLFANPSDATAAQVTGTYLLPDGSTIVNTVTVPPHARVTVPVEDIPGLGNTDVGATFTSTIPVVVERAMYLNAGRVFEAGESKAGVTAPSTTWFIAEGAQSGFFDCYLLLANPNASATDVVLQFALEDGTTVTTHHTLAPTSRTTLNTYFEDPRLRATTFSTVITSTQPIVAERAMWWPGPTISPRWYGGHQAMGSTNTSLRWAVAAGADGGPLEEGTFVLISNQNTSAAQAKVTAVFDDGTSVSRTFDLAPTSRKTVGVGGDLPGTAGRRFSIIVESVGANPVPLSVDVSRYRSTPNQFWSAGGSALGTAVP